MMSSRLYATYHLSCDSAAIAARAQALALEQSIECPLEAVPEPAILDEIVARVDDIAELAPGRFAVRLALAAATAPPEPGQLINMLFGNSSLQDDISLVDVEWPQHYLAAFGGPRLGIAGLRQRCGAQGRALTASALKPQGLSPSALAGLAGTLARSGLDLIKDDHGIADQAYSPFAARVSAVSRAVADANAARGGRTLYAPNLSGTLDDLRRQLDLARAAGAAAVLVAPMIIGLASFHALVREAEGLAVIAHPALAGAAKIAPPLLLGKLFRLLGVDATVFPHSGGRFGYSATTCRQLADAARAPWPPLQPCLPVPAGGMSVDRVPELLGSYGEDVMLLIGGSLLSARDRLGAAAAEFVAAVAEHGAAHGKDQL
jgi:ribulose-bisphosphate carboxylase large chain